ncbi:MAG: Tn3 family transposase [Cyanobacteria bacterium J06642_3]
MITATAGKLLPSTVLRKLGSYSRKNRLYQAFRALGKVNRTMYLLRFISDRALRREVTACTNIVESYHHFLDWLFFGKDGVITDNDPQRVRAQRRSVRRMFVVVLRQWLMGETPQGVSAQVATCGKPSPL